MALVRFCFVAVRGGAQGEWMENAIVKFCAHKVC